MTVATASHERAQLEELLRRGRTYDFLTLAQPYLDQVPHDVEIRLRMVQEYLKLGLFAPARALLDDDASVPAESRSEIRNLKDSLARMHGEPIPWATYDDRFEANLAALSDRGIDVRPIRESWAIRRNSLELWSDKNRAMHVRRRNDDGRWGWAPFFADHKALENARQMPEGIDELMPGPYVFEGLNFGWFFERVYRATHNTFLGYSAAIMIVEPDLDALAIPLHLHDWRELISDERVFWHLGGGCLERFRNSFELDHDLPFPRQAFHFNAFAPQRTSAVVPAIHGMIEARGEDVRRSLEALDAQYAGRNVKYWAKRFASALAGEGEPLRILGVVSAHTTFLKYSMRDVRRALEDLGHECRILTDHNPYMIIGPLTQHRAIREFNPDLFLVIDHLRPEFKATVPENLPIFTWDQDQLPQVITAENFRQVSEIDFLVGYSKYEFVRAGCDRRQYRYAGLPTSPDHFHTAELTDDERRRFTCDVSYVSHASQTPAAFHTEERKRFPDAVSARLLDAMFELLPPLLKKHQVVAGKLPAMVLEEASQACGIAVRDPEVARHLQWWYLWRLGDRIFRHEALEWVAEWARRTGRLFRLYGNGWEKHPTLAEFAMGPADNDRELSAICKASRINLQLMPAGFIHQRALDGLAAGGFFLARSTPHDTKGGVLRRLLARVEELGIDSSAAMLSHADSTLRGLLRDYLGAWRDHYGPKDHELLSDLRIQAEWIYADEAFPDYEDIAFDSAATFEQRAERFLADEPQRRKVTARMRKAVLERFTYRKAMSGFLRDMSDYLTEKARTSEPRPSGSDPSEPRPSGSDPSEPPCPQDGPSRGASRSSPAEPRPCRSDLRPRDRAGDSPALTELSGDERATREEPPFVAD